MTPDEFTLITRITSGDLRRPGHDTMNVVRLAGQAEATRRNTLALGELISVTMTDDFAPNWDGLVVLSRWRLTQAPISARAPQGAPHA